MSELELFGSLRNGKRGTFMLCMRLQIHHLKRRRLGLLVGEGRLTQSASFLGFFLWRGCGRYAMDAWAVAASASAVHGGKKGKGVNINWVKGMLLT